MNRQTFDRLVNDTVIATAGILIAKGDEYAGDADRLINFKRNAEKQGTTALQIWKQYIGKHIDSLDTYFKRVHDEAIRLALAEMPSREEYEQQDVDRFKTWVEAKLPEAMQNIDAKLSEPIEGRFHDVINYCYLGLALIKETREGDS